MFAFTLSDGPPKSQQLRMEVVTKCNSQTSSILSHFYGLYSLFHNSIVCRYDKHNNISCMSSSWTHWGKCRMSRCVNESYTVTFIKPHCKRNSYLWNKNNFNLFVIYSQTIGIIFCLESTSMDQILTWEGSNMLSYTSKFTSNYIWTSKIVKKSSFAMIYMSHDSNYRSSFH